MYLGILILSSHWVSLVSWKHVESDWMNVKPWVFALVRRVLLDVRDPPIPTEAIVDLIVTNASGINRVMPYLTCGGEGCREKKEREMSWQYEGMLLAKPHAVTWLFLARHELRDHSQVLVP
jgi:hypothetical protein